MIGDVDRLPITAENRLDIFFNENQSLRSFIWKNNINNDHSTIVKNIFPEKIRKRNQELPIHTLLMDTCIALNSLKFPPYVLLEIFDWLPDCLDSDMSHFKKITLIVKMVEFYKKKFNQENIKLIK